MLMGAIQVKNVPEELHERIRERARATGSTISDCVLELLAEEFGGPTLKEWIARIEEREPVDLTGVDVAEIIREGREERVTELLKRVTRR